MKCSSRLPRAEIQNIGRILLDQGGPGITLRFGRCGSGGAGRPRWQAGTRLARLRRTRPAPFPTAGHGPHGLVQRQVPEANDAVLEYQLVMWINRAVESSRPLLVGTGLEQIGGPHVSPSARPETVDHPAGCASNCEILARPPVCRGRPIPGPAHGRCARRQSNNRQRESASPHACRKFPPSAATDGQPLRIAIGRTARFSAAS